MFYVSYRKNSINRTTRWDSYEKANAFALYVWGLDGVRDVQILAEEEYNG